MDHHVYTPSQLASVTANCLPNIFRWAVRGMGGGGTVVLRTLPFRRFGLSGVGLSAQRALVAAGRLSSLPPSSRLPSLPWPPDLDLAGWRAGRVGAARRDTH
jgi:hypothetical protein